jgi:hypothetical protein
LGSCGSSLEKEALQVQYIDIKAILTLQGKNKDKLNIAFVHLDLGIGKKLYDFAKSQIFSNR